MISHRAKQRIHELMVEAIDDDLHFGSDVERQKWTTEAYQWRLPYWNWGLPKAGLGIPNLFTLPNISIKSPGIGNSTTNKSDTMANPLFRYELKVNDKITKMGDLPGDYKIDDATDEDISGKPITLPVRTFLVLYSSSLPY